MLLHFVRSLLLLATTTAFLHGQASDFSLDFGIEGNSGWTWHHENPVTPTAPSGAIRINLGTSDAEGSWVFLWFNAYIDPAASGPRADELRSHFNLIRQERSGGDLDAANQLLILPSDWAELSQRPLVIRPSFFDAAVAYALEEGEFVRGTSQVLLEGSAGVATWKGYYDPWENHHYGGRLMNEVWSNVYLGWTPQADLFDLSGLVHTAVLMQSPNGDSFSMQDFKDAVEIGILVDIQAIALRSLSPNVIVTPDPELTSGLIDLGPPPAGPFSRIKLSDPLSIRIPVSAISRGGEGDSLSGGGTPWIAVVPGTRLNLRVGFITPASSVIFQTSGGPVAMPLIQTGPLQGTTFVPNSVIPGFIDLVNVWGTNSGSINHSAQAPMTVLLSGN